MTTWIVIAVLYLLNVLVLRWLGGISAAEEALRRWGRSTGSVRRSDPSADS